ncbi:MAG TPA: HAMP domain-containing sensor histidine kinase [Terriglobales bacterium]|nr:HAMP domain-containing sensor histidine kinase [Terriglobales bacterium]
MSTAVDYSHEIAAPAPGSEPPLSDAFRAFSDAAQSLERSYFSLGEEVRRLRRELEQERELRLRREVLAQMAALVAHEVRNPLGSIELFADLLASSPLAGERREWVEQIQSGLRILSASVNNVLEFHSPSSQKMASTEVSGLLRSLRKLLQPAADRAGMELVLAITGAPLPVRADAQRLMQAFLNISLNAVRFAADGQFLRIAAHGERKIVSVQFEDRGPGVSEESKDRIFEPGFTTRSGGAGLGMTVAKQIIEQHGGSICVSRRAGQGAVFQVRLPRQDGEQ